jgi:peroxiredoxin
LAALQQVLEEILRLGASLVALSPEIPTAAQMTVEKNSLTFQVLCDSENSVARQFGLVFSLPADLREFYLSLGIDLPKQNGDGSWELPLPATYLIDRDGTIRDVFVQTDYVKRMEPNDILSGLRAITTSKEKL